MKVKAIGVFKKHVHRIATGPDINIKCFLKTPIGLKVTDLVNPYCFTS